MARAFFDTNVLIYTVSGDAAKADLAEAAISDGGWISVQVLNETARVLRRKYRHAWEDIHLFLDRVSSILEVAPLDIETHRLGLQIAEDHKIGIYDSMIVAAALLSNCDTLYSEDMHDGLVIDGRLTIANPFKAP